MDKEIEMLKRAIQYMQYIANGIDPLDQGPIDSNTFRQDKTKACLSYVIGLLDGMLKEKERKKEIATNRITVSTIASLANQSLQGSTQKIKPQTINEWLMAEGYLERNQQNHIVATERGKELGITSTLTISSDGRSYILNTYSPSAKDFILKYTDSIANATYVMSFKGNDYTVEAFVGDSLETVVANDMDHCYILADASADTMANTGSYLSVLLFHNKPKILRQSNIPTSNKNDLLIAGMLAAVKCIKKPVPIILLSPTKLGFETLEQYRDNACNEVLGELFDRKCTIKVVTASRSAISNLVAKYEAQ